MNFTMDLTDLIRLRAFYRQAPQLIKPITANILNTLAFKTREYDIQNIRTNMIVRNEAFLKSSLRVDKTQNTNIESQVSRAYSIHRDRFTGWEEQQMGKPTTRKRAPTLAGRGGNIRNTMLARARFKQGNKFYKPGQFQGKTRQQSFYFMMRVLGSRGGGSFLLNEDMPTKSGSLPKGLYELKGHKIRRLQKVGNIRQPKHMAWRTLSLDQLRRNNNMARIWNESFTQVIARYR